MIYEERNQSNQKDYITCEVEIIQFLYQILHEIGNEIHIVLFTNLSEII